LKHIFEASFLPSRLGGDDESGSPEWSIDMRIPLSRGDLLRAVAMQMTAVLDREKISQVSGAGFGAFFLLGGILATTMGLNGGLIRESRKEYGFKKRVEGGLDRHRPIFIVDDVLSSGKSAISAAKVLREDGFLPVGVLTVLRYGWRQGDESLRQAGLVSESLADLYPLFG
jgi:orotate phosphoribosyltransferase